MSPEYLQVVVEIWCSQVFLDKDEDIFQCTKQYSSRGLFGVISLSCKVLKQLRVC